jgi:hypothetical protein
MSKPPSDATTFRTLRRELKQEHDAAVRYAQFSNTLQVRLKMAEADAADWKRRFDLLLARTPEVKS